MVIAITIRDVSGRQAEISVELEDDKTGITNIGIIGIRRRIFSGIPRRSDKRLGTGAIEFSEKS